MQKRLSWSWLSWPNLAGIAGVVGLVVLFVRQPRDIIIALATIIVLLILLFLRLWTVLGNYVSTKYPEGHVVISTLARYSTVDGYKYKHEVFKHVHCKRPFMVDFMYGYRWTGSRAPTSISSDYQEIGERATAQAGGYDQVRLVLKKPLFYNEVGVVHVVLHLDDHDQKSEPHLDTRVTEPTQLLRWHVELRHLHARYAKPAKVSRRKIDAKAPQNYSHLATVSFDPISKSFEHYIPHPDVGYFYRLSWDKA